VVTINTVRSVGAAPTRRCWRVVGAALAVIGGVILGVAMADVSAAILRSALLSVGVAAIGVRAYRNAYRARLARRTNDSGETSGAMTPKSFPADSRSC
jgi:hypothetical protein